MAGNDIVEAAMLSMGGSDPSKIKESENFLKTFMKNQDAPRTLLQLLCTSQHPIVRQTSGVLLRGHIVSFSKSLPVAHQTQLKGQLLHQLSIETDPNSLRSISMIVATLASFYLKKNDWNELINVFKQAFTPSNDASNPFPPSKLIVLKLFYDLLKQLGPKCVKFAKLFHPFFMFLFQSSTTISFDAQLISFQCYTLMLKSLEEESEIKSYSPFMKPCMSIMFQLLQDPGKNEDTVASIFEVLFELLETGFPVFTAEIVEPLYMASLNVFQNKDLEYSTRMMACTVAEELLQQKQKLFLKKLPSFLPVTLRVIHQVMREFDAEMEDERVKSARNAGIGESEEETMQEMVWHDVNSFLDVVAITFPTKTVAQSILAYAHGLLSDQGRDWLDLRAGVMFLGISAEGCADFYVEHLGSLPQAAPSPPSSPGGAPSQQPNQQDGLVSAMLRLLTVPVPAVREATLWSLGQFADHFPSRIFAFHSRILPGLVPLLRDPSNLVVERVCITLESFFDGLTPKVMAPYLPMFMDQLGQLLGRPNQDSYVQSVVLSTVSSIASASGSLFTPYFSAVASSLLSILVQPTTDELAKIQCSAMECLGHAAVAVGKQQFEQFAVPATNAVLNAMKTDRSDLAENGFVFFACMITLYGPQLGESMIAMIANQCFQVLGKDEEFEIVEEEQKAPENAIEALASETRRSKEAGGQDDLEEDLGEDEDDDDDDEDGAGQHYRVRTDIVDAKSAAAMCLGKLADKCSLSFAPHIPAAVQVLQTACDGFHETVKENSITALEACVISQAVTDPSNGLRIPPSFFHDVASMFLQKFSTDMDVDTIVRICLSFQRFLKVFPWTHISQHGSVLVSHLLNVLKEECLCQRELEVHEEGDEDDEENKDETDDAELAQALLDDGVNALTVLVEKAVLENFQAIIDALLKLASPKKSDDHRRIAIGAFGDLVIACPSGSMAREMLTRNAPAVLPIIVKGLQSKNPDLQRNSCFVIGVFIEHLPAQCTPYMQNVLPVLGSIVQSGRGELSRDAAIDNAIAACCRCLSAFPPSALPVNAILSSILTALPTQADFLEDKVIFTTLFRCLLTGSSFADEMRPFVPRILTIAGECLDPERASKLEEMGLDGTPQEVKDQVIAPGLKQVFSSITSQQDKDLITNTLQTMTPISRRDAILRSINA
jgi:importin-4